MRASILIVCTIAGIQAGCASRPPDVQTEAAALSAVSIESGDPLVFRTIGDPTDESTSSARLTVDQAVRWSVLRSPQLQAALARVRIAQADAQQSRLLPNPVLSIAVRFPESGSGKPVIDAGLTADLVSVLRRPGSITAADARLRASSAEAVLIALDLASQSQERYYTIQSLEASLVVLRERGGLLQRLLDLAESRLRVGEGTRLDVVTLQTQRVELAAEIADQEIALRDERLALSRLIGHPSGNVGWEIDDWNPSRASLPAEQDVLRTALERRPEVQQREWELQALGAEHRLANWNLINTSEGGMDAERDGDWSIGPAASVPLPIFDTGSASRDRARAALIESMHHLTDARRQVVEDVRRAYSSLEGTRANLERVQSQLLPLQDARLQQAEAQFKAGQTDLTGLLLAEQDLRAARARLIDLQCRAALAEVRLQRAMGGVDAPAVPNTPHTPR